MDELLKNFEESFHDQAFSKSEKKALQQVFNDYTLDQRKREILIHKIFEIAKASSNEHTFLKILSWLETATKLVVRQDAEASVNKAYFSPGNDCLDGILELINSATRSLSICVFTISHDVIVNALLETRKFRNLEVKIITDNDKTFDHGSDVERLSDAGIEVRIDNTPYHMHHKFAIADNDLLLTGSYNWTRSAAMNNHENILITDNKDLIREYQKEFDKLWKEMELY